jgi:hypothetical protein
MNNAILAVVVVVVVVASIKKKKLQIGAANYSQNWLPNLLTKTNQLLLPFCRDGFVLSQTEQTHRRFSWSSHRRLTPIFSSATPLPTFFFFWGMGLGLQLGGSMQCSFCHKYV